MHNTSNPLTTHNPVQVLKPGQMIITITTVPSQVCDDCPDQAAQG